MEAAGLCRSDRGGRTVTSTGALKYAATSMCLLAPSNSTTTGVDLVLGACDGTTAQAWNPADKTSYVYDAFGNRIISITANDRRYHFHQRWGGGRPRHFLML